MIYEVSCVRIVSVQQQFRSSSEASSLLIIFVSAPCNAVHNITNDINLQVYFTLRSTSETILWQEQRLSDDKRVH